MTIPLDAPEVLEREFLPVRAKILEIAAALDRLDRADGSVDDDPRLAKIYEALGVLGQRDRTDRAEQVQLIFSLDYDRDWRRNYALAR